MAEAMEDKKQSDAVAMEDEKDKSFEDIDKLQE